MDYRPSAIGRHEDDPIVALPRRGPAVGERELDQRLLGRPHDRIGIVAIEHLAPGVVTIEERDVVLDELELVAQGELEDHARAEGAENRGAGTWLYLLRRGKASPARGSWILTRWPAVCH